MSGDSGYLHMLATGPLVQGHALLLSIDMVGSHFPLVLFIYFYLNFIAFIWGWGPSHTQKTTLSFCHVDNYIVLSLRKEFCSLLEQR